MSPLNFDPEVTSGLDFPSPITIYDSTIRKVLYTAGVRPSVTSMLRIAEELEAAGVRESHMMVDFWGSSEPDSLEFSVCEAILEKQFSFHSTVGSDLIFPNSVYGAPVNFDATRRAVDMLQEIGVQHLLIILRDPGSAAERDSQIHQLELLFDYMSQIGLRAVIDLPDCGRRDFTNLVRVCNVGIEHGVIRLGLSDSTNALCPEAMKVFVRGLRSRLTKAVPLAMHVHDDFGLATATTLAAASAGAHPDVAVNGMSYRAGFSALEEVVLSLEIHYGISTGIHTERLQRLSDMVASYSGFPIPPMKAVVGANAFLREIPPTMIPYLKEGPGSDVFPPAGSCITASVVGGRVGLAWGAHASRPVLREKLIQLGLPPTEAIIDNVTEAISSQLGEYRGYPSYLDEATVDQICRQAAGV